MKTVRSAATVIIVAIAFTGIGGPIESKGGVHGRGTQTEITPSFTKYARRV